MARAKLAKNAHASKVSRVQVGNANEMILQALSTGMMKISEIVECTGLAKNTVSNNISRLVEEQQVVVIGIFREDGQGGPPARHYALPSKAPTP